MEEAKKNRIGGMLVLPMLFALALGACLVAGCSSPEPQQGADDSPVDVKERDREPVELPTPNLAELVEMDGASLKEALSGYPSCGPFDVHYYDYVFYSNNQGLLDEITDAAEFYAEDHDSNFESDTPPIISAGDWMIALHPEELTKGGEKGWIDLTIYADEADSATAEG